MNIVINDWQTWVACSRHCDVGAGDRIFTESPGVYEALKGSRFVSDISEDLSLEEVNALGEKIVGLSFEWQKIIDRVCGASAPDMSFGEVLGRFLPQIMIACCYHFMLLDNVAGKSGEGLVVPYLAASPQNDLSSGRIKNLARAQTNYFGLVAQVDGISKNIRPLPLEESLSGDPEMLPGKTAEKIGFIDMCRYFFLKFSSTRSTRLYYLLFNNVYDTKWVAGYFYKFLRKDFHIFLYLINDLNLRLTIHSLTKGISITRVHDLDVKKSHAEEKDKEKLRIKDLLLSSNPDRSLDVPLEAAAVRIESYVNHFLLPMYHAAKQVTKKYIQKAKGFKKSFFLTSSLGSPFDILVSKFFHNKGIPVVNFQHGGIGLLKLYETQQYFSDMAHSDGYVCHNAYERDFYKNLTGDTKLDFYVQGVEKDLSAPFPGLARRLCRGIWKLEEQNKTLVYAPTCFRDGMVWPNDIYDMKYWLWMKELIHDVFGKTSARCIIKVHQKGLWSLQQAGLYQTRKDPLFEVELPDNVSIRNYPQLNYSRFAGDILMIDRATSTLGWALAPEVPLIYLEQPFDPLLPEVRDKMSRAVFVVDAGKPGWKDVLRGVLEMPVRELKNAWNQKRHDRMEFSEHYVRGPRKGRSGLMDWIFTVNTKQP